MLLLLSLAYAAGCDDRSFWFSTLFEFGGHLTPFRLNCPNCQRQILVRHAYLIGQTLPCPKCKELLTVIAPAPSPSPVTTSPLPAKEPSKPEPSPSHSNRLDSTALTKEDYGDWEAVLANIPQNLTDDQLENIAWDQVASDQQPRALNEEKAGTVPPPISTDSANSFTGPGHDKFPDDLSDLGLPVGEPDTPYRGQNSFALPNSRVEANNQASVNAPGNSSTKVASRRKHAILVASIGLGSTLVAGVGFWTFLRFVSKPTPIASHPLVVDANSGVDGSDPTAPTALSETNDGRPSPMGNLAEDPSVADDNADDDNTAVDDTEESAGEDFEEGDPAAEIQTGDGPYLDEAPPSGGDTAGMDISDGDNTDNASSLDDLLRLPGEDLRSNPASDPATSPATAAVDSQPTANNKPGDAPESTPSALSAANSDTSDDSSAISEQLPDIFGPNGFGQLLTPHMNIEDTTFSGKAPLDELDLEQLEESKAIYSHPDPQQVPLWSDKTSAFSIGRIRFTNQTLASCIDLFSRMSGVGITIDWPSLRAVGLSETLAVSNDLQNQTLDQIVRTVLDQNDLFLDIPGDGLPLVRPKPVAAEQTTASIWDLSGFSGSGSSQSTTTSSTTEFAPISSTPSGTESVQNSTASLGELLVEMWGMSSYCSVDADQMRWESTAPDLAKASVWSTLQLLAKLKDGNDFPWPEPTDAPIPLFDPEDWHQSQNVLSKQVPATVHLPELRPVTEILSIAAKETGNELVIDWQAAWQHGLVPTQTEISVVRNRTFPQIAKRFKDQYSLEFVSIGKNKILLTTPVARKTRFLVMPIRLPEEVSLEELKRSLYLLAPISSEGKSLFKVSPVPGSQNLYLARIVMPTIDQLDDDELHLAFGWEKH